MICLFNNSINCQNNNNSDSLYNNFCINIATIVKAKTNFK